MLSRDTLLTPPTPEEWAKSAADLRRMMAFDPGKVWTGTIRPALDSLPRPVRDAVLTEISKYRDLPATGEGAENSPSRLTEFPAGTKDSSVRNSSLRQMRDGTSATLKDMAAAAQARWAGR